MKNFGRVLTAMVTPFNEDYTVNYVAAAKLAKYLVDNGSDGVVVAGSTGEASTMTHDEELKLFSTVLDAIGDRAVVIAGTGSNDTKTSIDHTGQAEKLGVHGAMLVGPYYNKPPQQGLYQHFKAIAESTSLPLLIYNIPGRCGTNILPETIIKLSELENVVAVKEASGSMDQVSEIIRNTNLYVYSGDDSLTLPILSVGGTGIISVAAHLVGKEMQEMVSAFLAGNIVKAQEIHHKLTPLFKSLFVTTNPIPIKAAVNLIGLNAGPLRMPLVSLNDTQTEVLKKAMRKLALI
ncbi:MAG: Dihydrodipicolinate synthase [Firmicutes bacterium]|nr:Dihydrodipicolinate synthase [Bacillota bacterium]